MPKRIMTILLGLGLAGCTGNVPAVSPDSAAPPVALLTRTEWGAKPPTGPMRAHTPTRITIHHTGEPSRPDLPLDAKMRALQAFSQRDEPMSNGAMHRAWPHVPYHYYVDIHGRLAEGRDWRFAGDTNTSYDPAEHLLIVLEGNFENEQPGTEQMKTLSVMLRWASARWHIPADSVAGHRDFARTACPGANLYAQLDTLRAALRRAR